MNNKRAIRTLRHLIWVGVLVSLMAITVAVFMSWVLYQTTVDLLTENLRSRLLTVSITQAANIDYLDLEALQVENDWQKPEWTRVVTKLNRAKYSNDDIVFMYIFRKRSDDPTMMEFVADADSIDPYANISGNPSRYVDVNRDGIIEADGPDKLQWPGQPYDEASEIPETFQAYNGPLTASELYTDSYGTVLTGYAPIKDDFGRTVAVLATDIKADDFLTVTRQTLLPFVLFIGFLVLVILTLTAIIINTWFKKARAFAELDQMKTEFVSIASHQLRSPLTVIKGYSSMLLEGSYGEFGEKVREAIDRIFQSSQKLVIVIEDFLNISRIELGTMKYAVDAVDVKKMVGGIVNEMRPSIEKNGLRLHFDSEAKGDYIVRADVGKISQVVTNLIDNAVKYTKKGEIKVEVSRPGAGAVRVSVQDTGVGISQETMPKLFQKFSRASNASRTNIKGTGLGLYVAKQIVDAHGGKIWAESAGEGKGSTFIVEFKTGPIEIKSAEGKV